MTTFSLLRAEGLTFDFLGALRAGLLGCAALWSIVLAWKIAGRWTGDYLRRCAATFSVGLAASIGVLSSALLFWI
jgi:hypothetical protein